ncbi:Myb domain protein 65, putative isoform 3 [Hibiscus syriacus]|uniref:Myb domain protein 65, putative isoform 3 n=1 Tax=Hibiscus syriacus TaxID=106335 RepID=A0A6A3CMS3_HIBSY|nr:Myb domain protein 65, putative isoform 3 [Hibiscus syriacus]
MQENHSTSAVNGGDKGPHDILQNNSYEIPDQHDDERSSFRMISWTRLLDPLGCLSRLNQILQQRTPSKFGVFPDSHTLSDRNFSTSEPVFEAVKLGLPSFQYPETELGNWGTFYSPPPLLESVDAFIQSPPPTSGEDSDSLSPRNSGLLDALLNAAKTLSSAKNHASEKSSNLATPGNIAESSTFNICEMNGKNCGEPLSPMGNSATSLLSDCISASGSSLDEQPPAGTFTEFKYNLSFIEFLTWYQSLSIVGSLVLASACNRQWSEVLPDRGFFVDASRGFTNKKLEASIGTATDCWCLHSTNDDSDDNGEAQVNEAYEEFVAHDSAWLLGCYRLGLPREYQPFMDVVSTMKEALSVDNTYAMLVVEKGAIARPMPTLWEARPWSIIVDSVPLTMSPQTEQISQTHPNFMAQFRSLSPTNQAGIVHRLSCPHTFEQNNIVERKHRHLVEMALVLLAQASLPMEYWSYAIIVVVQLINKLPTKVLQGIMGVAHNEALLIPAFSTLMIPSSKLSGDGELLADTTMYRSIVGSLLYVCHTRPELAFSVGKVAQFMHKPREIHLVAVKRILRYLAGTVEYGLVFFPARSKFSVSAFADADWGANITDRRSILGYGVFLDNHLVAWSSKKQNSVSRSTMEAEYKSLADATAEVTWVSTLLAELGLKQHVKPVIWCDNTGAVAMSAIPVYHAQSKHVDLDVHFVREKVATQQMCVNYIPAAHQVADGFTKPLSRVFSNSILDFLFPDSHEKSKPAYHVLTPEIQNEAPIRLDSCHSDTLLASSWLEQGSGYDKGQMIMTDSIAILPGDDLISEYKNIAAGTSTSSQAWGAWFLCME